MNTSKEFHGDITYCECNRWQTGGWTHRSKSGKRWNDLKCGDFGRGRTLLDTFTLLHFIVRSSLSRWVCLDPLVLRRVPRPPQVEYGGNYDESSCTTQCYPENFRCVLLVALGRWIHRPFDCKKCRLFRLREDLCLKLPPVMNKFLFSGKEKTRECCPEEG